VGALHSAWLETASGKDPPATFLRRCYVAAGIQPGERAKGERSSLSTRRYGSQYGFCVSLRPKIRRSSKIEISGFSGS
jgi:hypothetical protein